MITEKSGVHSANVGLTNSFRKISNSFWWKNSKPLQLCCTHCITTAATTLPDCFSLLQWTLKWTWFYLGHSKYYAWLIDWLNPIFNASLNEQKQITYMRSVSCIWCFFHNRCGMCGRIDLVSVDWQQVMKNQQGYTPSCIDYQGTLTTVAMYPSQTEL